MNRGGFVFAKSRLRARVVVLTASVAVLGFAAPRVPASARLPRGDVPPLRAIDPSCAIDFDSLVAVARRDYAGYQTAVQLRPAALSAMTDTVRRMADSAAVDAPACKTALARWLAFFRDGHLRLFPVARPDAGTASAAPTVPAGPDRARPALVALDSTTVLLRIPSFNLKYKPVIDSLLAANTTSLARTPVLIIDVRGNGGGGDAAFAGLIPLLYTGPIQVVGADVWASPENAAYFRSVLTMPVLPESTRALVRRLVAEMERQPNRFVPTGEDTVLRLAAVRAFPRTVAVLFDHGSASSTEEFLLHARQSRKTILFSRTRSAGAIDYANVRQVMLPSGRWRLQFGTSRSRRLPAHPIDPDGLEPTVQIPSGAKDEVAYVRGYLAGRPGS